MSRPLCVLVIDDSEDDAMLVVRELKRSGYVPESLRVDTPFAMRAALEKKEWDIILSDHNMPGFNASEALLIAHARDPDMPFVLVSGSIGESLAVSIMRAGASDYVQKADLSLLGSAIDRALRESTIRRERNRAIVALRESEERFALAVQASRDGLWDWNMQTRHTYRSPRWLEMLGFKEGELDTTSQTFFDLIYSEDLPIVEAALQRHLAQRVPYDVEFRATTKQGESRWYCVRGQALWDEDGKPIRMVGSLSDVTERKQAEEALREQFELVKRQKEAIRVLSTPLIEVWDGVLTVPVLGSLDQGRAAEIMDALLAAVTRARCHHVIIDLTGVSSVDTPTADHLLKLVRAVELLGARGIVVGIKPQVAQAIVAIGTSLAGIMTLATLRDALVFCMKRKRR